MQPKGNAMKKVVIVVLVLLLNTLFGMENNNQQIDWPAHKKLYFEWYGYGTLGTKKRWKDFKRGVLNGTIKITSICQAPKPLQDISYYLAYSRPVRLSDNRIARFMYPSPNNAYSGYPIKDTDVLYTIDTAETSVLVTAQWNTNRGIDNEQSLPLELHPSENYFSDWKNNPNLWIFWTKINNILEERVKL